MCLQAGYSHGPLSVCRVSLCHQSVLQWRNPWHPVLSKLRCLELRSSPVSPPFPIPAGLLGSQGCTVGSRLLCSNPAHNPQPPQGRSRSVKRTSFGVGTSAASPRCGDAMRTTTARITATRTIAVSRGDQGRGKRGGRHAPLRTWLHPSWGHLPQASRLVLGWVALSCWRKPGGWRVLLRVEPSAACWSY